jgi:hypothetical protein
MTRALTSARGLGLSMLAITKHPRRQQEQGLQQREHRLETDANQPERNGEKPKERPEDKRQQRQGPAEDQKQAPKDEGEHMTPVASSTSELTGDQGIEAPQARTPLGVSVEQPVRQQRLVGAVFHFHNMAPSQNLIEDDGTPRTLNTS